MTIRTGQNRSHQDQIIEGGKVLQPVLYSLAVEQGLGKKVDSGRLFYCTTAGGFADHAIPISDYNSARDHGLVRKRDFLAELSRLTSSGKP